jgi:hypothetical protein
MVRSARIMLTAVLLFALPSLARSECPSMSLRETLKETRADLIFAGTFMKKDVISRIGFRGVEPVTGDGERFLQDRTALGLRLTFQIDRVWKGPAAKTPAVHQVLNSVSTEYWKPDTAYLIFASRATDRSRSDLLLHPGEESFIVHGCTGWWTWGPVVEKEVQRALGRGRNPH